MKEIGQKKMQNRPQVSSRWCLFGGLVPMLACCLFSLQPLVDCGQTRIPVAMNIATFFLAFLGLGGHFASGRSVRSYRAREVHHIEFAC